MTIDSTQELGIVKLKRYEKGKLISTWDESFDEELNHYGLKVHRFKI